MESETRPPNLIGHYSIALVRWQDLVAG